ncbi:MAG: CapA family protein [Oscillospiraceae bacterium]
MAYDAKDAGFDLLSTANNHCRDKGLDGLYRTLDVLDEAGLAHVGTYRSQAERDEEQRHLRSRCGRYFGGLPLLYLWDQRLPAQLRYHVCRQSV